MAKRTSKKTSTEALIETQPTDPGVTAPVPEKRVKAKQLVPKNGADTSGKSEALHHIDSITPEAVNERLELIFEGLRQKSTAKQAIYRNTLAAFELLRKVSRELVVELSSKLTPVDASVAIEYVPVNEMEFHIRFSGDLLVFVLHSNIVTFPDDYGPMRTDYVEADFRRRFFGHIMAYNFMADSIKYQRMNDPGYLVGRLLINIDSHYFLEGVQQLEMPDLDMSDNQVTADAMKLFVESAMIAAVNNDLIAPPLPEIQKITVKQKIENQQVSRGSKVGFSFSHQQRPGVDGLIY
ncbi:hypothetical protein [Hymenobacter sp. BT730]|uniref:hypothetical protein n=1 Tax=Hymenobacter sp. BT730 TaxID=3063332 RepID=UPI0026DFC6E3|nr:hypothetical protein [Hymenobacter sp. BT730]